MAEKKVLKEEDIKKVAGGSGNSRWCYFCDKITETKINKSTNGNVHTFVVVCSVCGKAYGDGGPTW